MVPFPQIESAPRVHTASRGPVNLRRFTQRYPNAREVQKATNRRASRQFQPTLGLRPPPWPAFPSANSCLSLLWFSWHLSLSTEPRSCTVPMIIGPLRGPCQPITLWARSKSVPVARHPSLTSLTGAFTVPTSVSSFDPLFSFPVKLNTTSVVQSLPMLSLPLSHVRLVPKILSFLPQLSLDILYSFADVDPSSGAIKLTDSYADQEVRSPPISSSLHLRQHPCHRNATPPILGTIPETICMGASNSSISTN